MRVTPTVSPRSRPRPVLGSLAAPAIAALLLACLLATAVARINGYSTGVLQSDTAVASVRLGFTDLEAGRVNIYHWDQGRDLQELAAGEGSFVRGVLRALARERRSRGLLAEAPFTLTSYADGSLVLEDPLTRQRIELQAFGPDNAAAFAVFLAESRQES